MSTLNFDTGVKTYTLNGACEISFNPSDTEFIGRIYDVIDAIERKSDAARGKMQIHAGKDELRKAFAAARELDTEICEMIDGVLNEDVCGKVFGNVSVTALADGLPLWANLLLAVLEECDTGVGEQKAAINPRIEHIKAKYRR